MFRLEGLEDDFQIAVVGGTPLSKGARAITEAEGTLGAGVCNTCPVSESGNRLDVLQQRQRANPRNIEFALSSNPLVVILFIHDHHMS